MTETMIPISTETRHRLKSVGRKDQTYDELLNALMDFWLRYRGIVETEAK